jgi:hypothetical protein
MASPASAPFHETRAGSGRTSGGFRQLAVVQTLVEELRGYDVLDLLRLPMNRPSNQLLRLVSFIVMGWVGVGSLHRASADALCPWFRR